LTFKAFEEVFVLGKEWEETEYYRFLRDHYYRGWPEKLKQRLEYNTALFNRIKNRGYLPRAADSDSELEKLHPAFPKQVGDEIRVAIGRENEVIFVDGRHRLAAARVLRVPSIPVRVVLLHSECHMVTRLR
jgi:hypothetical protein